MDAEAHQLAYHHYSV